jgi:inhibitor of KinA
MQAGMPAVQSQAGMPAVRSGAGMVRHRITSLSETAVLVEFGREISVELNDRVLGFADLINAEPFPGFVEVVPAYASAAVYFDPTVGRSAGNDSPLASVTRDIEALLSRAEELTLPRESRVIDIPVVFDGEDLNWIAETKGLSSSDVVDIFISNTYRVFMLGFLPGFAYMGEVDERIAASRRASPRTSVPKGSVGIAGRQTGIDPLESPGGWQLIGRTSVEMFTPDAAEPCLLRPGDEVRFIAR